MKKPEYHLAIDDRGTYLYAHLTGQFSFAAALSYWNDIADRVKALRYDRLLVHEALTGSVSETEIYDIIMDLLDSGLAEIQIAFFDENRDDAIMNLFGQSLANSKGASVKLFKTLEAAQHWIET